LNKFRKTSGLSIWLLPDAHTHSTFKNVIRHLSDTFSAPLFEPHITLSGTPDYSEKDMLISVIDQLAAQRSAFSVHTSDAVCGNPPFQRFYIPIDASIDIQSLSKECNKLVGRSFAKTENFHFSLMYGFNKCDEILQAFQSGELSLTDTLYIQSIALTDLTGLPNQWKIVYRRNLLT
jgi:hypothetical protein